MHGYSRIDFWIQCLSVLLNTLGMFNYFRIKMDIDLRPFFISIIEIYELIILPLGKVIMISIAIISYTINIPIIKISPDAAVVYVVMTGTLFRTLYAYGVFENKYMNVLFSLIWPITMVVVLWIYTVPQDNALVRKMEIDIRERKKYLSDLYFISKSAERGASSPRSSYGYVNPVAINDIKAEILRMQGIVNRERSELALPYINFLRFWSIEIISVILAVCILAFLNAAWPVR